MPSYGDDSLKGAELLCMGTLPYLRAESGIAFRSLNILQIYFPFLFILFLLSFCASPKSKYFWRENQQRQTSKKIFTFIEALSCEIVWFQNFILSAKGYKKERTLPKKKSSII